MVEDSFARAALPVFEAGLVEALEWSFDIGWASGGVPAWTEGLLDHYAQMGRLWGHGVTMSPLSADAPQRHRTWLQCAAQEVVRRNYLGVSEHFGFMGSDDDNAGAPLPPPPGPATVALGRDALARLAEAVRVPVGLENLALALGPADALEQGPTLSQILEGTDRYLVLDLHNLWCQAVNYDLDPTALLHTYPLGRVRVMHVSGGSWTTHGTAKARFRRDTHDDGVPAEVFEMLETALAECERTELVLLEQLGTSLDTPAAVTRWREDFERLRHEVYGAR